MKAIKILVGLTICVLAIDCLGMTMIAIINPECFFFGAKLNGERALAYLVPNILVGIACIYLLLRYPTKGALLSILYCGYNLAEISYTNFYEFSIPVFPAPEIPTSGLVLAIALLVVILISQKGQGVKLR